MNLFQIIKKDKVLFLVFALYVLVQIFGRLYSTVGEETIRSNLDIAPRAWIDALAIFGFILTLSFFFVFMLLVIFGLNSIFKWFGKVETNRNFLSKLINVLGILVALSFFRYLLMIFYSYGYVFVLFNFLRTVLFPMLTDGVNWFIANVLSWLVPGLVTNFVYDALKRSIFRKQKS